ncbi:MAG TPA: TMEM175 family protein [Acidimicrobiales bacterium]|nr:TMEM175 family protein [Acidimicrobiales bacterium]
MSTRRLESFSDGVLAVAITLLSLDLAVGGPGHGTLAHQLNQRWPSFAAYVVSFLVIGIIWINHHSLFSNLERIDRVGLFLNLLLLLFVVAIPFVTATLAAYLRAGGSDSHLAAALYAAVSLGMGLAFAAMFLWSSSHEQFRIALDPRSRRTAFVRFSIGNLAYLLALALAFVSAWLTLVIVALVAVYYSFEQISVAA